MELYEQNLAASTSGKTSCAICGCSSARSLSNTLKDEDDDLQRPTRWSRRRFMNARARPVSLHLACRPRQETCMLD